MWISIDEWSSIYGSWEGNGNKWVDIVIVGLLRAKCLTALVLLQSCLQPLRRQSTNLLGKMIHAETRFCRNNVTVTATLVGRTSDRFVAVVIIWLSDSQW